MPRVEIEGAEFTGQLFFRLWRALHTNTAAALGSIGLSPPLFAVLNYLRSEDGAIQQRIGTAMKIDPSTMVSLVDRLERDGLAKRRPSESDRRAREIVMTPDGKKKLEQARKLALEVEDEVLQGLSAAERRQLVELMKKAFAAAPAQPPWTAAEEDG